MMLTEKLAQCNNCALRKGCRGPVAGAGKEGADVMFVGEAPGEEEDKTGQPFVGKAGRFLDSLLGTVGLHREEVVITNVVKCRPPHNSDPKPEHIRACSMWLEMELATVRPAVVVALGRFSANYMLNRGVKTGAGEQYAMEHVHGIPFQRDFTILPAYHPAAGMHDTAKLRQIFDDFAALGELLQGADPKSMMPQDAFPKPRYKEITSGKEARELLDSKEYALDLEIVNNSIWSMQVAVKEGEAYFIPRDIITASGTPAWSEVTVHNYLYDAGFIDIPKFLDTMVMAYLLGLPQGLKELASRLCGMEMKSYQDVTRSYRRSKAIKYLSKAAMWDAWPEPEPVEETAWDNKLGMVATKTRNPQPIGRKIKKILADSIDNMEVDPFQRWYDIDARERREVERVLGALPDADLRDAPHEEAVRYSCRDADATLRVKNKLMPIIEEMGLDFVLRKADLPTLLTAKEMMEHGLPVSTDRLTELSKEYGERMEVVANEVADIAGYRLNPSSNVQVAELLYNRLGFKPTKMTPSGGMASTDDGELKKVNHPVVKKILEYRGLAKNKDSFADALLEQVENGRIHTTIKTTRTETGRWSSSGPNLQAQPTRTEEGKRIRKAYVAPAGKLLLSADANQQEVRMMAHVSQCKKLLEIYRNGGDVHTQTSAMIFGVDMATAAQEKYRYPSKRVTFGVIYDITPEGLLQDFIEHDITGWKLGDCDKMIKGWYKTYPEVWDWRQEQIAFGRRYGYVTDMFGRIRYTPELLCPIKSIQAAGARQAGNMPIQGGCATIIKMMMTNLQESRKEVGWEKKVLFLMQIHDEVLMEIAINGGKRFELEVAKWAKRVMEGTVTLSIPLVVDVKVGENWGEMKKVEL